MTQFDKIHAEFGSQSGSVVAPQPPPKPTAPKMPAQPAEQPAQDAYQGGQVPPAYGQRTPPQPFTQPMYAQPYPYGYAPVPAVDLSGIESLLTQMSEQMTSMQEAVAALSERVDGMEKSLAAVDAAAQAAGAEAQKAAAAREDGAQKSAALTAGIDKLRADNMSVLRETMDFKKTMARKWGDELDKYRKMFAESVYDRILRDIADMYCRVLRLIAEPKFEPVREDLEEEVLEALEDLLDTHHVTVKRSKPGDKRSYKTTHAKKQVAVNAPEMNGVVIESISPAFVRGDICLVNEEVRSYVHKADAPTLEEMFPAEKPAEEKPAEEKLAEEVPAEQPQEIPTEQETAEAPVEEAPAAQSEEAAEETAEAPAQEAGEETAQ